MFALTCGVLILGYPVAFTLAGSALAFALLGWLLGIFDLNLMGGLLSRYFGVMVNEVLVAASTGIVGATVVTMDLLSLPTMLKSGYDPKLACGVICASGTLGQVIPPSIVLVILGDILQGANTQSQLALGNFAPEPVSVIDLFAGAFLPGLVLVTLYMAWTLLVALLRPAACPPVETDESRAEVRARVLRVLLPPAGLIVLVLGSVLIGALVVIVAFLELATWLPWVLFG